MLLGLNVYLLELCNNVLHVNQVMNSWKGGGGAVALQLSLLPSQVMKRGPLKPQHLQNLSVKGTSNGKRVS